MNKKTLVVRLLSAVILLAGVTLAIAWFAGAFKDKIPPGKRTTQTLKSYNHPVHQVKAIPVARFESALGSVRAVQETSLSARIIAKVEKVEVKAGQHVTKGDTLVELDDTDLKARVEQARQAIKAAAAQDEMARLELKRNAELYKKKILAPNQWDQVRSKARQAAAALAQAREGEKEAVVNLGFARIEAPITGVVIDKQINVGDMAAPGKVLLSLYDPKRMQLWARVRETLAARLRPGDKVGVKIDALDKECAGVVDEVVPASDVGSRTFLVKVSGPCPPGIHTGMFGKLLLPMGTRKEIHIPESAIGRVGQLTLVRVVDDKKIARRRYVRLGGPAGPGKVRVVSGLETGDRIARTFVDPLAKGAK